MGREIEIKIPLSDVQYDSIFSFINCKADFDGILRADKVSPLIIKQDEYYSRYDSREERIAAGEPQVIRIRTDDNGKEKSSYFTIKHKSRQNGIEFNKEDETFVEDADVIREMMEVAGYKCWFKKVKKAYGIYCNFTKLAGVDFHLELETVNQYKYVEIEVTQEVGDPEKIRSALNDFVAALGLDPTKRDVRSWVEILAAD